MNNYRDVYHFLNRVCTQYADKVAFTYLRDRQLVDVTYSEFYYHVRQTAQYLSGIVGDEKRIAIIAENSYEWLTYYWGIMLLGKSALLVDPEMSADEIAGRLTRFNITYACVGKESGDYGNVRKILVELPDGPALDLEGYEQLNREKAEAVVRFSTGTTGDFKAIYLCQRSVACSVDPNGLIGINSVYIPLPFVHVSAHVGMNTAMAMGSKVCIGSGNKYVLKDLQIFEPEMVAATPVHLKMFVQRMERRMEDPNIVSKIFGRNIKRILTGGASPQKHVLDMLQKKGIRIFSAYGSSEVAVIASGEIGGEDKCLGCPAPYLELGFENGEILVKSPSLFLGYAEGEDVSDDWYHTGDLGYLDESGRLFMTGRKKNLIILSNGKNVSPEHLEAELFTIPRVEEAIVYGADDRICAEIYAGEPDEEIQQQIRDCIREQNVAKPTYYQIQKIIFREEPFPRVGVGKIRRNQHG